VATLAFRPEATELAAPVTGSLSGRIGAIENLGSDIFLHVALTAAQDAQPVIIRVAPSRRFAIGDEVGIRPDPARVLQFDAAGRRLRARERVAA
jgi:multiple sugar transport system ATP-binding protein